MILFKVLTKKFVKDRDSQFHNIRVNFHKIHALFSTRVLQLGIDYHKFSEKGHGCAQMQRMASASPF
jgi:hypothetical protein